MKLQKVEEENTQLKNDMQIHIDFFGKAHDKRHGSMVSAEVVLNNGSRPVAVQKNRISMPTEIIIKNEEEIDDPEVKSSRRQKSKSSSSSGSSSSSSDKKKKNNKRTKVK